MKRNANVPLDVMSFEGNVYSTLDFCPPDAQDFLNKSNNFQLLRTGWELAPRAVGLIEAVKAYRWGNADWIVLADGYGISLKGEEDWENHCLDHERRSTNYYKAMPRMGNSRVLIRTKASDLPDASQPSYADEMVSKLFKRRRFTDFVIVCGDKEFPCHRAVVAESSPVFEAAVSGNMTEGQSGRIDIKDAEPDAVSAMLSFMYTGKLDDEHDLDHLKLLVLGDRYGIDKLVAACAPRLLEKLSPDTVASVARVLKAGATNPCLQPFLESLKEKVAADPVLLTAVFQSL